MSGRSCVANPNLACPWLKNIDAQIGIAKDDFAKRLFFGKKAARQAVELLIRQRADVQQYIETADCPGAEFRTEQGVKSMFCGILVVNSAMQNFNEEVKQQLKGEKE